jgi:cytochrome b subunit of formate dehydrogenase
MTFRQENPRGPRSCLPRVRRCLGLLGLLVLVGLGLHTRVSSAADAENCLMCHRFRGLSRVDKDGDYRLFYIDESLYNRGPHARVRCTGCHADIDKIPHDTAKPVDCLRSCHIEEPTREILFTHAKVDETLQRSVHALTANDGTPKEFQKDLPRCKDCHDNPLFRPVSFFKTVRAGVSDQAMNRCLMCHSDASLTRYYYSHVTTRMHKARDPREVVAMCSTCHANAELASRHHLPDVVSSYLETYHGKAVLFGSALAPDCLDCHANKTNVHDMHAVSDPRSSVHADRRAATCQTEDCHKTATAALASFDVHADRNRATHRLEFGVALFFVVLTLAILLPILTLNVLGLLRDLVPSREAEADVERLTAMAQDPAFQAGGTKRFTGLQRVQHVFLVVVFAILCLTGMPMKFPQASWAPAVYQVFGGIQLAPIVHRVAGVALLAGFALHVGGLLLRVTRGLASAGQLSLGTWIRAVLSLPMIPRWQDLKDLVQLVKYVCFLSPRRPHYGRFSWKEKLEYFGLFWGITLLGVTGILLWSEDWSGRLIPGWGLNVCYLAHTYESFLALAHIVLVHIPGVLGRPGASPLSGMVLNGRVSPQVVAEEHGAQILDWYKAREVAP